MNISETYNLIKDKSYNEQIEQINKILQNTEYDISDYNYILEKLQDEKSRKIFFNRIMVDNTNDAYYSLMMQKESCKGTNLNSEFDRIMNDHIDFLLKNHNYSKKIYIVGFSDYCVIPICDVWQSFEPLNVVCIFDDVEFEYQFDATGGKKIEVYPIDKMNEFDFENSIVIIASYKYIYLKDKLISKYNVSKDDIFTFYVDAISENGIQYFGESFIKYNEDDVLIDGGAFNLHSTFTFNKLTYGLYEKIYAFEPIDEQYNICKQELENSSLHDVELYKLGLSNEKKKLRFASKGSASRVDENGDTVVNVDSIDNILNGAKTTIIKLDIEGSEYEALKGAEKTIKKYKPTLMICVYHKPNDILKLTKLILSYNSDYKIYFRHYGYNLYETVAYFLN